MRPAALGLVLLGCGCETRDPGAVDRDGDGYPAGIDCDDRDFQMNWLDVDDDGQASCGGDCNDFVSEMSALDPDGDGNTTCDAPPDCDDANSAVETRDTDSDGWSTCDGDCDDNAAQASPGGDRVCGDAVDSDCDGFGDCRYKGSQDALANTVGELRQDEFGSGGLGHTGDFDRDGVVDLVTGGWELRVYYGPLLGVRDQSQADVLIPVETTQGLGVGDVTGDGVADAVATYSPNLWEPSISLVFAGPLVSAVDPPDPVATLVTESSGNLFTRGYVLDVDQDGVSDLVRGDPDATDPYTGERYGGCLYIARGPVAGDLDRADLWHISCLPGFFDHAGLYGQDVIDLSGFTGSGEGVLAISAPDAFDDNETVHLLMPQAGVFDAGVAAFATLTDGDATFANSMADLGDTDADGYDDLAVTREHHGGSTEEWDGAYVLHGGPETPSGPIGDIADKVVVYAWQRIYLGPAGDFDADGHRDLTVLVSDHYTGLENLTVVYGPFAGVMDGLAQAVWFVGPDWRAPLFTMEDLNGDGASEIAGSVLGQAAGDPELLILSGRPDGW